VEVFCEGACRSVPCLEVLLITNRVAMHVEHTDTGAREVITANLTREEADDLRDFNACVEELRSARLVQKGLGIKWSITFQTGDRPRNPEPLPEEIELREFLLVMRPFLLHRERTSFNQVRGLLRRRLNHPYTAWYLKRLHQQYSGDYSRRLFEVRYDGNVLNSERTFLLLLNGYWFHKDREKQFSLAELRKAFPPDISDAVFTEMLTNKAVAVLNLAKFLQKLQWLPEEPELPDTNTSLRTA
jgi:hypothetical protein